ncbi:MAG: MFS transporter [Sandaracinaceae bacterium]
MREAPAPLWTVPFALAFVANFADGLALALYLHLPGYLSDLGASERMIGLVFGVMSGAAIVIRPPAGRVMDRWGRRPVILVGCALHVVACSLYLTVDAIDAWLFLVRCLQGLAQGMLFSSLFTYAADIVPPSRRTEGIGLFGVSGMVPLALGPLVGDLILAHGTYRDLFWFSVAVSVLALLASLGLRDVPRSSEVGGGFFKAARQRDLMPIWMLGSCFAAVVAAIFTFLKRFIDDEHVGSVGLFFACYAATAVALRVLFGWVPDRVGPTRVLYPALASFACAVLLLSIARDVVVLGAAGVAAGFGHGYAFPILSALVVDRAHPADRGSAMSLFTAVFDAGVLVGSPILGAIAEATDFRTMFLCSAVAPIGGGLAFGLWERALRADVPSSS